MATNRNKAGFSGSRDLGIGGAGKGDADRTSDVKKYQENLDAIERHPEDKTGFKQVGPKRWRKTFGNTAPSGAGVGSGLNRARSLAARRAHGISTSCSSDH